jgi:Cysteine-rich secretory protein family
MRQEQSQMILKTGTRILAFACLLGMAHRALAQSMEAQQLMEATNQDRAQHGLEPLRWDPALARAAQAHAYEMVRHGELSHQYDGEPELAERAGRDGAHFSTVAENIATAPNPQAVEDEWMHSPPHRHNILDPRLTTIGIGLVHEGNNLWAVEDFSAAVAQMGSTQIEEKIEQLVAERGVRVVSTSSAARQTCSMDHGFAGARPNFVMRWEGSDLNRLPDVLEEKISTGRYHTAAVGACSSGNQSQGFTSYRLAVLLF